MIVYLSMANSFSSLLFRILYNFSFSERSAWLFVGMCSTARSARPTTVEEASVLTLRGRPLFTPSVLVSVSERGVAWSSSTTGAMGTVFLLFLTFGRCVLVLGLFSVVCCTSLSTFAALLTFLRGTGGEVSLLDARWYFWRLAILIAFVRTEPSDHVTTARQCAPPPCGSFFN